MLLYRSLELFRRASQYMDNNMAGVILIGCVILIWTYLVDPRLTIFLSSIPVMTFLLMRFIVPVPDIYLVTSVTMLATMINVGLYLIAPRAAGIILIPLTFSMWPIVAREFVNLGAGFFGGSDMSQGEVVSATIFMIFTMGTLLYHAIV